MNKYTGHRMNWWDHNKWLAVQSSFTPEFWEDYRNNHKGTGDSVALKVREHFQAASKWDRMARNSVTQGSGATILKTAIADFFNWIVDNNYFKVVKICAMVHDELLIEYPKDRPEICGVLEGIMERASSKYCKFSKIPAKGEVATYWLH